MKTLKLPTSRQLVERINNAQAAVLDWYITRGTPEGKARLREARKCFMAESILHGGGRKPYTGTTQASSVKLTHNAHITAWEQTVTYGAAASSSGVVNMCAGATPQCIDGCLQTSGHLGMSNGQRAMRVRTTMLWTHTADYLICLIDDTERHARRIHKCGKWYAQRLNGTTDTPWEQCEWLLIILRAVGVDMHFDYTKLRNRKTGHNSDPLYYLARSATERTSYDEVQPLDVVIVDTKAKGELPKTWCGFDVIDGDYTNGDLRFLDLAYDNAVVLLRAKGKLRGVVGKPNGFVKPTNPRLLTLVSA